GPAAGACRQDLLKLLRVHGLDEVNVEAGGPRPLEVVRLTVARHRDEPRPGNVGADAPGDLVTVDARQADVDQRDVGPEAPRRLYRPAVQLDEVAHEREADAEPATRALERAVALHEQVEHAGQQLGPDPCAAVAHAEHRALSLRLDAQHDFAARRRVLDRVG